MSRLFVLAILVFSFSCAHQPSFQYDPNYVAWLDRSADDLHTHPYFASMPMEKRETENGVRVYSFKNSGGIVGKNGCSSNGFGRSSCSSAAVEISCNHVFTVSKNKVKNYQRVGDCGQESLQFRPLENGQPILTEGELKRMNSRSIANERSSVEKTCGLVGNLFGC